MSDSPNKRALNPVVIKLGLVSLFADISSEMLYPITPLFLSSVLGASMTSIGFIEGFAEAIASLLKTHSGFWSDRIKKRKPFVVVGYSLAAFAKPMIGLSTLWWHVLAARGVDRVGKGLRSAPRDALLSESVPASLRGAAFGWHRSMDTLGAAIGPLLAIVYLGLYSDDLRTIFFLAIIPGLIAASLTLAVRESTSAPQPEVKVLASRLTWTSLNPAFKKYLFAWTIFSLANSSDVFLLMKAKNQGLSTTTVILLYCLFNLTHSLLSPYLGKLSDRMDRRKILAFGLFVFAGVYLGMSQATELWHFILLFGIYGFYMAATDGVGKALAVDLIPRDQKASGLGLLGTATGLATIVASTVAGLLWDQIGPSATFYFGATGAILAAPLIMRSERS